MSGKFRVHTFLGVLAAKRINPDILHIHAVGPALLVPFARILVLAEKPIKNLIEILEKDYSD